MMMTMIRTMYLARRRAQHVDQVQDQMMTTKVMRMLMSNDMAPGSHAGARWVMNVQGGTSFQQGRDRGETLWIGAVEAGGA